MKGRVISNEMIEKDVKELSEIDSKNNLLEKNPKNFKFEDGKPQ